MRQICRNIYKYLAAGSTEAGANKKDSVIAMPTGPVVASGGAPEDRKMRRY
jgi:hypothetical protein